MKCRNHPEKDERSNVDYWGRKRKAFQIDRNRRQITMSRRWVAKALVKKYWEQIIDPTIRKWLYKL